MESVKQIVDIAFPDGTKVIQLKNPKAGYNSIIVWNDEGIYKIKIWPDKCSLDFYHTERGNQNNLDKWDAINITCTEELIEQITILKLLGG